MAQPKQFFTDTAGTRATRAPPAGACRPPRLSDSRPSLAEAKAFLRDAIGDLAASADEFKTVLENECKDPEDPSTVSQQLVIQKLGPKVTAKITPLITKYGFMPSPMGTTPPPPPPPPPPLPIRTRAPPGALIGARIAWSGRARRPDRALCAHALLAATMLLFMALTKAAQQQKEAGEGSSIAEGLPQPGPAIAPRRQPVRCHAARGLRTRLTPLRCARRPVRPQRWTC
jgi:hypothetical protein